MIILSWILFPQTYVLYIRFPEVVMLLRGVRSGHSLLKSQSTGQVGGKKNLLYLRFWQLVGGVWISVQRPTFLTAKQEVRAFIG